MMLTQSGLILTNELVARLGELNIRHAFSTFRAGNMSLNWGPEEKVKRNLNRFYSVAGFERGRQVHIYPEHGDKIKIVGKQDVGQNIKCDGLITQERNIILSLAPADCYPIVMTDKQKRFIALLHAGRNGVELEIVPKTIKFVQEKFGVAANEIIVGIGPGIKKCCYSHNLIYSLFCELQECKVPISSITAALVCTCCEKDEKENFLFFSHQRSKTEGQGQEGRFLTLVAL